MNALKNISKRICAFFLALQFLFIFVFFSYQKEEVYAAPLVPVVEVTAYEIAETLVFLLGGAAAITVEESTTGALQSAGEAVLDEIYNSVDLYCMANGFGKYNQYSPYTMEEFTADWNAMIEGANEGVLELNANLLNALSTWYYDTFVSDAYAISSVYTSSLDYLMKTWKVYSTRPILFFCTDGYYSWAIYTKNYSYNIASYYIEGERLYYTSPSGTKGSAILYISGGYYLNSSGTAKYVSSNPVVSSVAESCDYIVGVKLWDGTDDTLDVRDVIWPQTNTAVDTVITNPGTYADYYDIVSPFPATWEEESAIPSAKVQVMDKATIAELVDEYVAECEKAESVKDVAYPVTWVKEELPSTGEEEDTELNEVPLDNITVPYVPAETGSYIENLKKKFPFCIPFDLVTCIQNFKNYSQADEAPVFTFSVPMPFINYTWSFTIDMNDYLSYVKIFRFGFLILFVIGLMFSTSKLIGWQLID